MAPRNARRWALAVAPSIALTLLALGLALWRLGERRRQARAVEAISVELSFEVQPERAAEAAFLEALDITVARLRGRGLRIGEVLPQPRSARLVVPGLDEAALVAALEGLPLTAKPAPSPVSDAGSGSGGPALSAVALELAEAEAARVADRALAGTAAEVRRRVVQARPCEGCEPALLVQGSWRQARLLVRLPWIDDLTERRVRAAVAAPPPLPAPVRFVGARVVRPQPPSL